jgi:hypothetical protein
LAYDYLATDDQKEVRAGGFIKMKSDYFSIISLKKLSGKSIHFRKSDHYDNFSAGFEKHWIK